MKGLNALRYAKLTCCFLLIVCLLSTFALAAESDFSFTLNSNKNGYLVQKYSGSATEVVVPESYNGLPVTGLAQSAFENNAYIKSVSLPSTITYIGARCFKNCSSLTSVTTYAASGAGIRIPGDVDGNGIVNIDDAILMMRHASGEAVTINAANADVNADQQVNINDVLLLLQHEAGWGIKLQ